MIAVNSTLNDVMREFYESQASHDGGNIQYNLRRIGSRMQSLNETTEEVDFTLTNDADKLMYYRFLFVVGSTISAGRITIETAHVAGYTGTWHSLVDRGLTGQTDASIGQYASGTALGPLPVVRGRINTALVGGTVDVYLVGCAVN